MLEKRCHLKLFFVRVRQTIKWVVTCLVVTCLFSLNMTNSMSRVAVPVPRKRRRDEVHYEVHYVHRLVESHVGRLASSISACNLNTDMQQYQQQQYQQQQQQLVQTHTQGLPKVFKSCL